MITEPIISLKETTYQYAGDKKEAVKNISLDVHSGEFLAILGHNGSGKSTLAKLLNGLLLPTHGSVTVCGLLTTDEKSIWEIRSAAGMVFQNPDNQMVSSIVEEDVAFGPENLCVAPQSIRARVDDSLMAVRMSEFAQSAPHMLSGGQKQRVAIAGVLAMQPKIIILDEPTAMLDPLGRTEVLETIRRLNKDGITVVWITHFMEEAVSADRIIIMDEGEIALSGTPREVFARVGILRDLGLDIPPATELAGALADAGYDIARDIITEEDMVERICQLLRRI